MGTIVDDFSWLLENNFTFVYLFIWLCVSVSGVCTHMPENMCGGSEIRFLGSILWLPGTEQTQVTCLGSKCFYLLNHVAGP